MQAIKQRCAAFIVMLAVSMSSLGETIYSVPFDYTKIKPTSTYFHGRSKEQIDHLCRTGENAGTADVAACSQRDFENASGILDTVLRSEKAQYREGDTDLRSSGYPVALPHFEDAQRAWTAYRDNQCYAETYSLGQASMRYMAFWDCMTRITKERIADLKKQEN